ncbi:MULTISPECIES: hypothetical protein [unclassified Streptomyces]|uniref:hypothetical protein n=1 Tax=unclassified Streptomyces TaxID=2593676 RepID=UPI000FFF1702|nr:MULTISPECIES: hypothetical protein [unclassified Streptomyces]
MGWTDEYRESRSGAFDLLDQAHERAAKNRKGDSRSLALIHLTDRDPATGKRRVRDFQTPIKRSGMYATESSFYSQGDNGPEAADAKKDAEKATCSDARAAMLSFRETENPYRITIDVITNRRNCNNCLGDVDRLCQDVANMFPEAEVKVNTLASDRDGVHEVFSSVPGRLNRETGEYRSKYGSFSATPMHLSSAAAGTSQAESSDQSGGYKYWKHSVYGGEPTRYEGPIQEPVVGGGAVPSITDESPYTSSNYQTSSGSDSEGSGHSAGKVSTGSGDSGVSELSATFNEALNPGNWLPEQNLPNTHLGPQWQLDSSAGVYYRDNHKKIAVDNAQYELVATVPDSNKRTVLAYSAATNGHLGLYTFDKSGNSFQAYPGTDARQWASSYLNTSQSTSQAASSSKAHGKKKQKKG